MSTLNTWNNNLLSQEILQNKLWENSRDYMQLQKMVDESNWKISWEKLMQYTKIKNWEVEWIYWDEDLDLRGTNITTLWKLKKVWGKLDLRNVNINLQFSNKWKYKVLRINYT